MRPELDSILVEACCPTCGSRITAPYVQVKAIGLFACGCGTIVDADMARVAAQAIIGLADERDPPQATPAIAALKP